ncbi:MAG: zinc-ribbon domain-containing protein [Deltaproteobacteria bacterium]|nr:zinc-ribbon domain-containing protein [Deltaproteobacteria bacterium]
MIIECENCSSKFSIDETLLKSEGSKVKCSMCKHVFIAYPIKKMPDEELMTDKAPDQDLEDTVPLDSAKADFDLAFEKALKEAETEESVSERIGSEEGAEPFTDDDETVSPRKKKGSPKILIFVLSIILLIAIGGALLFLSLRNSSERQESIDPGVMRLSFRAVTGSFVESNTEGQLFVIKGMVTNNYPKPRSYILVKGSIQDDKGKTVKTAVAYAGNSFSEKEIREMSSVDLKKGQENQAGDQGTNVNIPSGGTIPFMIIFEKLPENISEFTVEAISSAPGK